MAWGYSPRPVVKARRASLDKRKSKSLGILLVFSGACAGLLAFGIMSQVLGPSEVQEPESMMLRVDEEESETSELLIVPEENYEKGEDTLKRKYRVFWKKPSGAAPQSQKNTWEQDQEEKRRKKEPDKSGSWDEMPG